MTHTSDITSAVSAMNFDSERSLVYDGIEKKDEGSVSYPTSQAKPPPEGSRNTFPRIIKLNVGGRRFETLTETLRAESGLFQHQLSERFTWTADADGSYFLDADPQLFEHLLRFMRRPQIFPLFYSRVSGFDYDLYNRLGAEAEYFQVDALYEWIKEKKYLQAVKAKTGAVAVQEVDSLTSKFRDVTKGEELHFVARVKRWYICPHRIYEHMGRQDLCAATCRQGKSRDNDLFMDKHVIEAITVEKEIIFDENVCRAE